MTAPQIKEKRGKRIYVIGGVEYDSVTSVLSIIDKSGPLIPWAVKATCDYIENKTSDGVFLQEAITLARKEATRQKEEAADIGSAVHQAIHEFVKTGKTPTFADERATNAWEAFTKWALSVGFKPLVSEVICHNTKYRYAGTLDLMAELSSTGGKRKTYLIDLKSSKGFYEDQFGPQVAAYEMCYTKGAFDGIAILRLDKVTGLPSFHDCTEKRKQYQGVFLAALDLYRKVRALKEKEEEKDG